MTDKIINQESAVQIEEFIKKLDIEELIYLNRLVVNRIRLLEQVATNNKMMQYNLGDKVCFDDKQGRELRGTVIKINKKTISVLTDQNSKWNVHPTFLRPVQ